MAGDFWEEMDVIDVVYKQILQYPTGKYVLYNVDESGIALKAVPNPLAGGRMRIQN